ncbi:hypothetical protein ABZ412_06600 [Nocardia sp. NPDC005746]|uniref:hypothetical protein n=1 Tax=Nocardia sp. NPDC005746 TaxID=3157062 RepID=UPI0033E93858
MGPAVASATAGWRRGSALSAVRDLRAPAMVVTFFDAGATIGTGTVGGDPNGWGQAKVSWIPKTAGQHLLTARVESRSGSIPVEPLTVQVRAATSTGELGFL